MLRKCLLGGILGAIIVFIWMALSWTFIPWHHTTMQTFANEALVQQTIQANSISSGIYFAPLNPAVEVEGPQIFAAVYLPGLTSMKTGMLYAFLIQFMGAFLVTWLLLQTKLDYAGRLKFVAVFALAAGIITHLPYWTWFKFGTAYTLVQIADLVIAWFLAGLVLARIR